MFFKKLFGKKSWNEYESRGDGYFSQGRYADARLEFEEALELLASTPPAEDLRAPERLGEKMAATGYQLALMNISEARSALASGDSEKAGDYLELAARLSQDPEIVREISTFIPQQDAPPKEAAPARGAHGCATCSSHDSHHPAGDAGGGLHTLAHGEQYEILIAPLPGDLPERYRAMGEEFSRAYMGAHGGDGAAAFQAYAALHAKTPSDICLYEMAVIKAHSGAIRDAESLLRDAIALNPSNPLCCLSLVQLYTDLRRFGDARTLLDRMQAEGMLGAQILLLLGDNAMAVGATDEAEDFYRQALAEKGLESAAAERLIPILERSGRTQERDFLAKKHCGKGCC